MKTKNLKLKYKELSEIKYNAQEITILKITNESYST